MTYDLTRQEMLTKTAGKVNGVLYWGRPLDRRNQTLTPNPDTLYFMAFVDTTNGPIVLDLPPASEKGSFNGNIVTTWQMPLEDVGLLGVDAGKDGKFVVLPPGWNGTTPPGHVPLQSDTFGGYAPMRRRPLLATAAREAGAWLEQKYDAGLPPFFSATNRWTVPAPPDLVKAVQSGYADVDSYPVDSRGLAYSYACVGIERLGVGQMYLISIRDADGDAFDGGTTYRLTVPPHPPVEQYWSVTAYDRQTHALIRNMPWASRSSQIPDLKKNADGSVDVYFGPVAPPGREHNWVKTDPARTFELMFRAYAPTKALFEKTWVLPDVQKVQ